LDAILARRAPAVYCTLLQKRLFLAVAALLVIGAAIFLVTRRRSDSDPDIILVTIDTLRADAVSAETTPFLAELAKQGISFENAHAHNVMTLPSHTNILTGLLPYQHGVRDNAGFTFGKEDHPSAPSRKQTTIAATLRARGYATGAFVAAYPLDSHFGLDADFDVYDDNYRPAGGASRFATPERPAGEVLAAAQQWLDTVGDRKKFLWVHLYEPHHPYEPVSPFKERYPGKPYTAEVAAVDDALGKFLRPILARRPNTLLVVTADHGEGLGDHQEEHHGLFAYEETLRVPLLVIEKAKIQPRVEKSFVRHIDIVPTVLARLGIAKPPELLGESLLDLKAPRDTYFEALWGSLNLGWAPLVGMIHDGHKYVDLPVAELYDLARDPRERKNLVAGDRRTTARIRELLATAAPASKTATRNVSPDEARNLMSLGYLTGTAAAKKSYTADDDPKNLVPYHLRLNAALEHYRRGEADQAIAVAGQLVKERPEMTMAKDLLALVLQQSERNAEAEEVLRQTIATDANDDAARKRLGLLLSEKGEAKEAVQILSAFANANEPDLLNAYGIALADTGRAREAVQQFQRVLQLDPDNAAAFQNLGVVALRMGDVQQAQQFLTHALQLNAKLPRALNTLGVVYARQGDLPRAVDFWKRAVAADPRQYDALYNIGLVQLRAGNRQDAREALERFARTAPPQRYAADIANARKALATLR
jgi:arylsulfatase A-like enzyme/Tfp pilus assembly protein PilF